MTKSATSGGSYGLLLPLQFTDRMQAHLNDLSQMAGAPGPIDWKTGKYDYASEHYVETLKMLLSFQKDGTLALDSSKLTTAANKDFESISKLFTASGGVVTKLQTVMDGILKENGTLATKTKGLQASLKIVTDQQTAANSRLQDLKDNYTNQFNRLNVTLATMQARQSYLTQQLTKLSKSS